MAVPYGAGSSPAPSTKVDWGGATPREVEQFHEKDDVDTRPEAHHHTIGPGPNQAAPGSLVARVDALDGGGEGGETDPDSLKERVTALEDTVNTGTYFQVSARNAQSINNTTYTLVDAAWGSPDLNEGGWLISSGVVTVPKDGLYRVSVTLFWASPPASTAVVNGCEVTRNSTAQNTAATIHRVWGGRGQEGSRLVHLSQGDLIRVYVYQSSGAAQNLGFDASYPNSWLSLERVAD